MRWPWIGRGRLDDARDEIEFLRAQVDALRDQMTRLVRHQNGLYETPRAPRKEQKPMPKSIHDYINSFANPSMKKEMRDRLYRRHARGEPWGKMEAEINEEREHEQTPYGKPQDGTQERAGQLPGQG